MVLMDKNNQPASEARKTTSKEFDLIVIGTGAGGSAPAMKCRRAGWKVAVVDDEPYGGTCSLRGCDPKKVLVGAADAWDWSRRMAGAGIGGNGYVDWQALMRFKGSFTDPVAPSREKLFGDAGIAMYHGSAKFLAADRIEVSGDVLTARHFHIATGASPAKLGIPGEEHLLTSTDFLELESLPPRIAFIGAGYISFEFAHVAQRAGSQAIIFGRGAALKGFDADIVGRLVAHSRTTGIDLRLYAEVLGVEKADSGYVIVSQGTSGAERISADLVVHGAGRAPNTGGLNASAAGIALDEKGGIAVNGFLQSVSNPIVYAAGDVALPEGSAPLTPVAAHEGHIVASNLLRGNNARPDYRGIPSVVFTIPPL